MGDPAGDGSLEGVDVESKEHLADGPVGGGSTRVAQAVHLPDRLVAAPLSDRRVAAAAAEDRGAGVSQDRRQGMPPPRGLARVGNLGQEVVKAKRAAVVHRRRLRKIDSLPQINEPTHRDRLLRQMMAKKFDLGCPFDLVVTCNGGDDKPLTLPSEFERIRPGSSTARTQAITSGPGTTAGGWPATTSFFCSSRTIVT